MNVQQLQIPIAIIIAGIIVASAIIFGGGSGTSVTEQDRHALENTNSESAKSVRAVDESDHVLGSRDAKVVIVEYSDFECPFCSRMHPTLEKVVEEYKGEVAWVYRHFPLTSIHSRATKAAVASECAAELGGNDSFWSFAETLFKQQRNLGDELYQNTAAALGIDENAFTVCMNSGKHETRVSSDLQNAIDSGGRGTPFSVVLDKNGNPFPFSGALPYEQVRSIVENALISS